MGICTVQRSSADSSAELPMKSKLRQLRTSFKTCMTRFCWHWSWRFKGLANTWKKFKIKTLWNTSVILFTYISISSFERQEVRERKREGGSFQLLVHSLNVCKGHGSAWTKARDLVHLQLSDNWVASAIPTASQGSHQQLSCNQEPQIGIKTKSSH